MQLTERRLAEAHLGVLLESAADAILFIDTRGRVEFVNRRTEELFGYEPGALTGREVEVLVPDRFRAGHAADRTRYFAEPRTREMGAGLELYGRRKDGSEFAVDISLSPTGVDGKALVIAIVRDVSERRRTELERLAVAREQAALRRVAMLVAHGAPREELFAVVTEEVVRLLGVDHAHLGRYESDGTVAILADWSRAGEPFPVGARWRLGGENLCTFVAESGRPARIDSYADASGPLAVATAERGFRSGVGAPIIVDDRLWGVIIVGSSLAQPLPADTEGRLASFTELVATAIANAVNRDGLARLAEEQAALRRVAMLVAHVAPREELFAVVTEEVGRLLGVDHAHLGRYESDGTVAILADWSRAGEPFPVGARWRLGGENLCTFVAESGRPARIDSYADASGPLAVATAERGFRSGVGAPIIVDDRLWGVIIVGSSLAQPLPADTEGRLASFTELVATAIANADNRAGLAASRARIVATADETRRRIERDLHDGAQQRLVQSIFALQRARNALEEGSEHAAELVERALENTRGAHDELRELARGIHPAVLTEAGLTPALNALARRCPVPVALDLRADARLPESIEVTAYYVVSEALTNAAKHSNASTVRVNLDTVDGHVRLSITDDGVGGADPTRGSGLVGLRDRIEAIGGTLTVQSRLGQGTRLLVEVPINADRPPSSAA